MGSRRLWGGLVSLVIPGAGHFAIGRPWRGVAWWSVAAVSVLLLPFVVWMPLWFSMLLVRIVSAVEVCVLRDVRAVAWGRVVGMWLAWIVVTFAFTRIVRAYYLQAYTIPAGSMIPTLQIGDHIFINKLADVGPGDVIVFTNPCEPSKDFVKRIVAVGGDTVEVRCGTLYVNGEPVPTAEVEGECSYWDEDFSAHESSRAFECSAYTETIGNRTYTTVYDPFRPNMLARTHANRTDRPMALIERDFPDGTLPGCHTLRGPARAVGYVAPSPADTDGPCAPVSHYVVPDDHVFVLGDNRQNSSDSRIWGPVPADHIKGKAFLIWWSSSLHGGINWSRIDAAID